MARRTRLVFINCPFDDDYRPLFFAMIFAVSYCGFRPRCALEVIDSATTRISKIEKLIEDCALGIHDISRTELDAVNYLPRFNMPLELGLFLGAKRFGDATQKRKKCLVLDRERYRFQKFMSDIAGQDVTSHDGNIGRLIESVRAFLNSVAKGATLPSGSVILSAYEKFNEKLPEICAPLLVDPSSLDYADFTSIAANFVSNRSV